MSTKFILLSAFFCLCVVGLPFAGMPQQRVDKPQHGNGMMFTPNKGQITDANKKPRPDILYKGNGKGTDVYIRKTGISYVESNIGDVMNDINEEVDDDMSEAGMMKPKQQAIQEKMQDTATHIKIHRVDMDFVGASANCEVTTDDRVEGYNNYYLWNCPEGITHVYSYNELTFKNIYPNIDVVYHGDKDLGLKNSIMVYPGGNPALIKMKYSGYKSIRVINNLLMIETSLGIMTEQLPEVYQIIGSRKMDVKTAYKLEYTNDNACIISYQLESYNPEYVLVIDPWITYYGGGNTEYAYSIAADKNGNIAFTGLTNSSDFPVSVGAFQTTVYAISGMAFVVKMDACGQRIFGTYLGGSSEDIGTSIVCDIQNNIYVAGSTQSSDFPVGSSPGNVVCQSIKNNFNDTFLAKFDALGLRLWATFYGGENNDFGTGVAIDKNDNSVILYGHTESDSAIATPGSFQTTNNGGWEVFVVKFTLNGTRQWGTYIGSGGSESSFNICCDNSGNIFFCGYTTPDSSGMGFPIIAGHQMVYGGGISDAFICKLNPTGTQLIWSSFYGGEKEDRGYGITCDNDGNVILGGMTVSMNGISTVGAYQTTNAGFYDGFLVKFDNNGVRQWGTYLGGTGIDQGIGGICSDANNNLVSGGDTYSSDFPVTSSAYQKIFIGSEDQFIATFRPDGSLLCSGYLGLGTPSSPNNETMQTQCIAVFGCFVYLYALTNCNYPTTPDAFQYICGGGQWEAAIAKLYLNTCGGISNNTMDFTATSNVCRGAPVNFNSSFGGCDNIGLSYLWQFQGGDPATSTEANPTGITYSESGDFNVKLIINQSCGEGDTLVKSAYIHINPCVVSQLEAPNVFTPNGDGFNDTYKVKYHDPFEKFYIKIWNRWGTTMYESNDINAGWNCNKCADGTYYYIIEALGKDGKKYDLHGTITVLH